MPNTAADRNPQPNVITGGLKAGLLDLIAAAETPEVAAVLDELWTSASLSIRQAPQTGLVMIMVRDPFDTDFFLGEVLVTEAEVACDGVAGHGTIMGDEPERALLLAAVEALELSRKKAALTIAGEFVERLKQRDRQRKQAISKMTAATAVNFESMQKERVDFGSLGG